MASLVRFQPLAGYLRGNMADEPLPPIALGSFGEDLHERLKDFDYAVGYLLNCLKEGEGIFRLGLRDVIKAQVEHKKIDTPLANE